MEETTNNNTPDEFYSGLDFFDFLNKGNEISDKRKVISEIIEKHVKQAIEEVLQFVYKDTYSKVNDTPKQKDYPKITQNAFKVPIDILKDRELVYHCVDGTITRDNFWETVLRSENDFETYKILNLDYSYADSSSIIFAKARQKDKYLANVIVDQLIISYNKEDMTITIYCTKDFPEIDTLVDTVLDFSGFKRHIKDTNENKKDDIKAQEAIEKIQKAAKDT